MSLNETHSIDTNQFNIFEKFLMTIIFVSIGVLGVIGKLEKISFRKIFIFYFSKNQAM
jgi:hypothetical protein